MPLRPILDICDDPYATRRAADRGLTVPCYRCAAEEIGIGRGCFFVNRGTKVDRRGPKTVDPKREGARDQLAMFPTPVVQSVPTPPEQGD